MSIVKSYLTKEIPNLITFCRFLIVLPIIFSLELGRLDFAWILFLIGGVSDLLDGYLARKTKNISKWGAKFDPMADKLMVLAAIIWLNQQSIIPSWAVLVLISREFIITEWRKKQSSGGPASRNAKYKTLFQFISILFMLWPDNWCTEIIISLIHKSGIYIFMLSLIMSVISALEYLNYSKSDHQG